MVVKNSDEVKVTLWPVGTTERGGGSFILLPNPVRDLLTVTAPFVPDPVFRVTVMDALDKVVQEREVSGKGPLYMDLQTGHLPVGYYFLRITGNATRWQTKFIIEK